MLMLFMLIPVPSLLPNSCWLSTEKYTIYFFAAPAAAILIVRDISMFVLCVIKECCDSFFKFCDDISP